MKILLKIILSLCILTLIVAFTEKDNQEGKFTIFGQVSGFPKGTKFYLRNMSTDAVFDSTTVENNSFKFEGRLSSSPEHIWLLATVDNKFIYTNLLIGNDNINIKADIKDFPWNVEIKGSKIQEDYNYSQSITKEYNIKLDSLENAYMKLSPSKQQEIGTKIHEEIKNIESIARSLRIDYIKSHNNTYSSVIELGYLKNHIPKDTIQKIFDKYTPEIKESKYAKIVDVFLKENISKIGNKYHDFEGLNQKGKKVKFSEIKGKYTLIDFTSAFCAPCIQATKELVEINKTYLNSLTIISFSGDPQKDIWLKSLDRDKVTWSSVWDGKGRFSETALKYGIDSTPTFVLINPEGIIIDKWIGYEKGSIISRLNNKISIK